jgi:hypothetical protein
MQNVVIKKLTCKGTMRQVFFCLRPTTPYPLTHCIRVYSILIHPEKGGRGGELNQREEERGNSSQSWVENTNMTDFITSL